MGCSDEEIANVETSSRNAIGFNVLSNAAETRATPTTNTNLKNTDFDVFAFTADGTAFMGCLLYTSPSPRDVEESRMPSSA